MDKVLLDISNASSLQRFVCMTPADHIRESKAEGIE